MAWLELADERGQGRVVSLDGDAFEIGRDEGADLRVVDGRVSRRHARLRRLDDGWCVEDLGSTNGITVNDERVEGAALAEGDTIGLGPLRLRFHEGSPAARGETVIERAAVAQWIAGRGPDPSDAGAAESQRRLRLLLELATALDAFDAPEDLLARFGEVVVDLFRPAFALVEVEGDAWGHDAGGGESGVSASVLDRVRRRGEALLVSDVHEEPGLDNVESVCFLGIHTAIGVPVLVGERQVGCLYVDRRGVAEPPFGPEDLYLLVAIGRLVSAAMAGAVRFARLDAQARLGRTVRGPGGAIGGSPAMVSLFDTIERRVGPVRSTVLFVGETGTGKTMLAQAVHLASPRRKGPFVKVNCAAIPRELIESELFGHEKGAFSGADRRRIGQFEAATGGTLFLDEVGELDPAAQSKLLTALQDREIRRVGAEKPIPIDVRLVAATNRDLQEAVRAGTFRSDLFYRLNVVRLEVPALRDRRADIPALAHHFLDTACHETGRRVRGFTAAALRALERYDWPGNVRELANGIERAVIFADEGAPLDVRHLPAEVGGAPAATSPALRSAATLDPVQEKEREILAAALARSGGNRRAAARELGWYPQKLYHRLKRYGLD